MLHSHFFPWVTIVQSVLIISPPIIFLVTFSKIFCCIQLYIWSQFKLPNLNSSLNRLLLNHAQKFYSSQTPSIEDIQAISENNSKTLKMGCEELVEPHPMMIKIYFWICFQWSHLVGFNRTYTVNGLEPRYTKDRAVLLIWMPVTILILIHIFY